MEAGMRRYSLSLHGHRTSVSLEPAFWDVLRALAKDQGQSVASLVQDIDDERIKAGAANGLSSALRVYVLKAVQKQAGR